MSAPGYQQGRDPTAVMGARVGAWVVDGLIYLALLLLVFPPFSPLAEKADAGDLSRGEACDQLTDNQDARACVMFGDTVYWTDGGDDSVIQGAVALASFVLVLVVLQGLTGATPGKALFGLRAVGEDGQVPGMGRAFVRSILWIVDGAPWCLPLVGFVTGLTSTGHRRVGDMAAKTFVVAKADAGRPVVVPGLAPVPAPAFGMPAYPGAPPTTYPGPGPGAYPGAAAPQPWGAPAGPTAPPVSATPWRTPSDRPAPSTSPPMASPDVASGRATSQPPSEESSAAPPTAEAPFGSGAGPAPGEPESASVPDAPSPPEGEAQPDRPDEPTPAETPDAEVTSGTGAESAPAEPAAEAEAVEPVWP